MNEDKQKIPLIHYILFWAGVLMIMTWVGQVLVNMFGLDVFFSFFVIYLILIIPFAIAWRIRK